MSLSLTDAFTLIAVSHSLLLALFFLWRYKDRGESYYWIGYLLGAAAYLFLPLALNWKLPRPLLVILLVTQSAGSFFYWIICLSRRPEGFRLRNIHLVILAGKVLLTAFLLSPRRPLILSPGTAEENFILHIIGPAIFSSGLAILGLIHMARLFRSLPRRSEKRRLPLALIFAGSAVLLLALMRLSLVGKSLYPLFAPLNNLILILLLFYLQLQVLKLPSDFFPGKKNLKETDLNLLQRLQESMFQERLFTREGLTIGELATELDEPEYRLRRLLNDSLGFRNFNSFLNHFRIQAATELLQENTQPILRIAMDLGYLSAGHFNRAFKEITGLTPTEFRKSEREPLPRPQLAGSPG